MKDLSQLRREIDAVDEQLTALLKQRMALSSAVADYKAAQGLPVYHPGREAEILERVGAVCPDAVPVYRTLFDVSRARQYEKAAPAAFSPLPDTPNAPTVVCQGCAGAYSDEAAQKLFPRAGKRLFVDTFREVVDAVEEGRADFGILPVENSTAGSVHEVYDLLMAQEIPLVGAVCLPVNHCLLALPDAEHLTEVISHPQALSQCAATLTAMRLTPKPFANTAMAAAFVAQSSDRHLCAVASRHAAEIYGLKVVAEDIQEVGRNFTRFAVIGKAAPPIGGVRKVSLILSVPHEAGALDRVLSRFTHTGLNLTKIESRPKRTGEFAYLFYLDFEGDAAEPKTAAFLRALKEELPFFALLGSYREMTV